MARDELDRNSKPLDAGRIEGEPMSTPQGHYETLLAGHYSWMMGGDFLAKARADEALLRDLLGASGRTGAAMISAAVPGSSVRHSRRSVMRRWWASTRARP